MAKYTLTICTEIWGQEDREIGDTDKRTSEDYPCDTLQEVIDRLYAPYTKWITQTTHYSPLDKAVSLETIQPDSDYESGEDTYHSAYVTKGEPSDGPIRWHRSLAPAERNAVLKGLRKNGALDE